MNFNSLLIAWYRVVRRAQAKNDKNLGISLISGVFMVLNIVILLYALGALCASATVFGLQRISRLVVVVAAPLLMAAMWMDTQPSLKPYQEPVLSPPVDSVPLSGTEMISQDSELHNPLTPTKASLAQGKALFAINCAMCHGQNSTERGPVGKKLKPPPPGLDHNLLQERSDAHIFKVVTFGFGRMPPFKGRLTQQQRWQLVNFLRTRE